jgi:hypothetical protein
VDEAMIGTDAKMVHLGVLACGVVAQMDYLPGVKRKEFDIHMLPILLSGLGRSSDESQSMQRQFIKRLHGGQPGLLYTSVPAICRPSGC